MITNRERGQLLIGMQTVTMRSVIASLLLCGFACVAHAQAPAGIDTGSLTRWPPYVHDAETLDRGRIVMSLVGGHSLTGDRLRNSSLYMGLEFGLTNRFLLAVAGSTSVSSGAATKLDDAVVHLRYRIANESPGSPAFAVAATAQRQTFLRGTGISPYELQLALIAEKGMLGFAFYGQAGYTTRSQPFEGVGVRRTIGERLIVSANYSYRHGRLFETSNSAITPRPTSSVAYATAYYSVSGRLGLTAAFGRSFPSQTDSGGFTRFFSAGFGFALKR
jgi:hypothetical protein